MRRAIIPGSYDPVTLGHISLIRRAAELFDSVRVVAMVNRDKRYRLTDEQRLLLLQMATEDIKNAEVDFWDGMLWEYVRDCSACTVIKGIRNAEDLSYELEMADYNRIRGVETILLPSSPEYKHISSTEVRCRLDAGEPLSGLVTPKAEALLREIWKKERETHGRNPN